MLLGRFAAVRIESKGTKRGELILLMSTSSIVLFPQLLKIEKMFLSQLFSTILMKQMALSGV